MLQQLISRASAAMASQCAVCRTWSAQTVCEPCVTLFGQPVARCKTCAQAIDSGFAQCGACVKSPPALDACLAAVSYEFPWAGLVADFKFNAKTGLAGTFALLMRSAPWVEPALDSADVVIAMPLSRQRLQLRGFNQAQLLAQALATGKLVHQVLLRIKDTPPQRLMERQERFDAVRDAFAIDPLLQGKIKSRRIVLVDDVMTSGASLGAAATALKAAGAAHVTALVFARTEP